MRSSWSEDRKVVVALRFAQPRLQDAEELQPGINDAVVVIELMLQNQNVTTPLTTCDIC